MASSWRIGQADFVSGGTRCGQSAPGIPGDQGQWLFLGDQQGPLAWLVLDDRLRSDAPELLELARQRDWRVLLLSGDSSPMVQSLATQLGIDDARGGLTPDGKTGRAAPAARRGTARTDAGRRGQRRTGAGRSGYQHCRWARPPTWPRPVPMPCCCPTRLSSLVQAFAMARRTPLHHYRKPELGLPVQWPDPALSPPWAGLPPGSGRTGHVTAARWWWWWSTPCA